MTPWTPSSLPPKTLQQHKWWLSIPVQLESPLQLSFHTLHFPRPQGQLQLEWNHTQRTVKYSKKSPTAQVRAWEPTTCQTDNQYQLSQLQKPSILCIDLFFFFLWIITSPSPCGLKREGHFYLNVFCLGWCGHWLSWFAFKVMLTDSRQTGALDCPMLTSH